MADFIFRGSGTAIVTPFTPDDEIDFEAFRRHINQQIDGGVDALVVLGTTGENATIWPDERRELVEKAIDYVGGRIPVIIGSGNNSTSESIVFSREASEAGADGLLVVGPYYNKPTQAGFRAHVEAIADATDTRILIYNVPGRTSFNILPETIVQLAEEVPSVVGVKEASGSLTQITDILAHRPESLAVYSGDDEITLPLIVLGGDGVVSVVGNVIPDAFADLVHKALDGRIDEARTLHYKLLPAMRACFFETNPIPIKAVLSAIGMMDGRLRLPLIEMDDANRRRVLDAFSSFIEVKV
jgi:4-hydroxy-tetrahydrodipicolinate synthase